MAVLSAPATAATTRVFRERFGSANQPTLTNALALAVDQGSGDLLVYDGGNGTLNRFKANGEPDPFSALGSNVIGGLETVRFAGETQIALDESSTATAGDIYVTQEGRHLVEIFSETGVHLGALTAAGATAFAGGLSPCGVAVDEAGDVYAGTAPEEASGQRPHRIEKFTPQANPVETSDYVASESFLVSEFPRTPVEAYPCNLAVGANASAGFIFGLNFSSATKIDLASGNIAAQFGENQSQALAIDPTSGNVLVSSNGPERRITEFDASGSEPSVVSEFRSQTATELAESPAAMAIDRISGELYAANGAVIDVYSAPVVRPTVETRQAEPLSQTSLRLNGAVDPAGVAVQECVFEYGPTTSYGALAPCAEPSAGEVGGGTQPVAVHADVAGLLPETVYHFRLVAESANGTSEGSDRATRTPSKPEVLDEFASQVAVTDATVDAVIDPANAATNYVVEYSPGSAYTQSTSSQVIPAGTEPIHVSATLTGLSADTPYHYRFAATNELGSDPGEDHEFHTFRAPDTESDCPNAAFRIGAAASLPDCRAYEMISPVDKDNGDVLALINFNNFSNKLDQSSVAGSSFTYSSYRSFADPKAAPLTSQYLAVRGDGGWTTESLSPPRAGQAYVGNAGSLDNPFKAFSADLCTSWLVGEAPPELAAGAIKAFPNLYRRGDCPAGYQAVTTGPGPNIESSYFHGFEGLESLPELQGVSADGATAVFRDRYKLTEDAREGAYQTYEAGSGALKLVCKFPAGTPSSVETENPNCSAGTGVSKQENDIGRLYGRGSSAEHAVSADGVRVYWTASSSPSGPGRIYLRLNGTETVKVSETESTQPAEFLGAAADGTSALFRVTQGPKAGKLYQYSLAAESSTEVAGDVVGVAGAGEDLSYIYFVSKEALASANSEGATAVGGSPNLYLAHEGTTVFVATLSQVDASRDPNNVVYSDIESVPIFHVARATPSGEVLSFNSTNRLTNLPNTDVVSGEADSEVFLYDANDGALTCVSCSPAGARPAGRKVPVSLGRAQALPAAALLPGSQTQLFTPRALADDGTRLFFTAYTSLSPEDANGKADVYEWEAPGAGSCTVSRSSYSTANHGCLFLISSGKSQEDSEFLDADPTGTNVFFSTEESLVGQDPGLIDIYDARAGGGFPAVPGPPPPCVGESCQGTVAAPGAGSPNSWRAGPGNPPTRCRKGQHRVKKHGKSRCVSRKHKKSLKHHRTKAHKRKAQSGKRGSK